MQLAILQVYPLVICLKVHLVPNTEDVSAIHWPAFSLFVRLATAPGSSTTTKSTTLLTTMWP